ncbi:hypothetical protein BDA99DRAFT_561855 [Phascolomyces articulosus]|uniref:PDEase domain-containing protein n=1 Tax=Phascolomyces articulosus TaxID=60185 RepID=A0AAD5JWA1_9FUNG|nr:hypothetical protein BDA99DRAFT_561855 [Phascolomyces articulosus]
MDPSHCSIVVLYKPTTTTTTTTTTTQSAAPYRIQLDIDDDENDNDFHEQGEINDRPVYTPMLQAIFGQVYIQSNPADAIRQIQYQQQPTLCLIDIDDDTSGQNVVASMAADLLNHHVTIAVCSSIEDFGFMLGCINAGAAEYLLKPLRMDVVKTLFLKLHHSHSVALTSSNRGLHHRIKNTTAKDSALARAMMDIYAPPISLKRTIAPLSGHRATFLRRKIASWDFCPFDVDHDDLIHCSYLIFEQVLSCPEMSHITVNKDQLYDFIFELSVSYHNGNAYHNFAHAVDVLQCLYHFLCKLGVLPFPGNVTRPQDLLRANDVFALLIAALGHDAAHPGVNNMFMINSATPLALLYNDRSVLESFHSMTLFQIFKKHKLDECLGSTEDYHAFRKTVVASILATDMSLHNDYVTKIKGQPARLRNLNALDESAREEERILLCSALIKCADISNVTRPFRRAVKWAELLAQEFMCQGDLERKLGMPVQPMNDRDKMVLEDMQISFIQFVATSLFESVSNVTHEMTFTVESMQQNLKLWETRKKEESYQKKDWNHNKPVIDQEKQPQPRKSESEYRLSLDASATKTVATGTTATNTTNTTNTTTSTAPTTPTSNNNSDKIFSGLPQMPAVAMASYGNNGNNEWLTTNGTTPAHDGVYCQCNIM